LAEASQTRKLAAILAADVAGYSRLMAADEAATVAALNAARVIFREHIAERGGREVDTAGDSVLATFPSVVEAVRCAVAVQDALAVTNEALTEERRMRFRIGVNLGDVIEQDDGTIYGDGVNIAARLEGLAAPGSVTISESAHMQVRRLPDLAFSDAGVHEVKNISEPVQAYQLGEGDTVVPAATAAPTGKSSIAVLPFDNMSGDAEQEYFSDGISEDLITELSRVRWLTVIARNSTFTYKGKAVDVGQVGRELGVRYVLEGSVRRAGNRVRITAQLIEAETGAHIWAERYDRNLDDIFELQDEITETIVRAIEPEIGAAERERARRKPTDNLQAWDAYQRGMWHVYRYNSDDMATARGLFDQAIDMDPTFAPAHAALAYVNYAEVIFGYADDPGTNIQKGLRGANEALALDGKDPAAHCYLGRICAQVGESESAMAEFDAALALNPSFAMAHYGRGLALTFSGDSEAALEALQTAMRLSPHDPQMWLFEMISGYAEMQRLNHEESLAWAEKAVRHPAAGFYAHAGRAIALAFLGRDSEAAAAKEKTLALKPDMSFAFVRKTWPHWNEVGMKVLAEGMAKAGFTEPE